MIASLRAALARGTVTLALLSAVLACAEREPATGLSPDEVALKKSPSDVDEDREIFRFDTFGNETFWSDTAGMHVKINALRPVDALAAGLKVDVDALPQALIDAIAANPGLLNDPASTVALIGLNAVVGVKGQVENGQLVRVGFTCALCHSTVDNSFTGGVGHRLDGWPNRDLNIGAIVAMSDVIPEFPYTTWGPGMYDPRFNIDGLNFPVVIPPAFGLRGVDKEIYTGDGPVSYWNAYVAITQMHGHGHFVDPRINVDVNNTPPDLVASKLAALRDYQLSLETPVAKRGTYDVAAAARGRNVFRQAGCAECHSGKLYTDINEGVLHDPLEVGQDAHYADRSATKQYRTTPLRGLWNPPQLDGPYFHDGSATSLMAVVEHYVGVFNLSLTARQKSDLVEFLKTL